MSAKLSDDLLAWYDLNARVLPWRERPGANAADPYRVWLSEVMLQQTTVAAVGPYFAKFTARWPSVEALAAADDADLMAAWAGSVIFHSGALVVRASACNSPAGPSIFPFNAA